MTSSTLVMSAAPATPANIAGYQVRDRRRIPAPSLHQVWTRSCPSASLIHLSVTSKIPKPGPKHIRLSSAGSGHSCNSTPCDLISYKVMVHERIRVRLTLQ